MANKNVDSSSSTSIKLVKVTFLGAPKVGKTSIVQQFVRTDFSDEYVATTRRNVCYSSVVVNDHLYRLTISDLPAITYFPVDSYAEWADYRFYGLRNATAYIMVFDLSDVDTFQYVRTMREQIMESRDVRNAPLLVVGNKYDLLESCGDAPRDRSSEKRRDIQNLVKKHWKCGYVECSARYNWRVVAVFKELMRIVDVMEGGQAHGYKEVSPMMDNIHDALDRKKCVIM